MAQASSEKTPTRTPENPMITAARESGQRGEWLEARRLLEQALEASPQDPQLLWRVALTYLQCGDRDKARQYIDQVELTGDPGLEAFKVKLTLAAEHGAREEIAALLRQGAQSFGADRGFRALQIATLASMLDDAPAALALAREFAAEQEAEAGGQELLLWVLSSMGAWADAITQAHKVLALHDSEAARYQLVVALLAQDQVKEAVEAGKPLLPLASARANIAWLWGLVHERSHNEAAARRCFAEGAELCRKQGESDVAFVAKLNHQQKEDKDHGKQHS